MKETHLFVSIIIPVRTITNYLKESIEYLKKLDYGLFEVLIFTDFPEECEIIDYRFKIYPSGKVGPAEKRNLALSFAKGEILAFLDDDAYPKEDWLKKALSNFEDLSICAVGGPSLIPVNEGFLERVSGEILASFLASGGTTIRHIQGNKKEFVDDYPTVNLLVRKEDFKNVGGFDKEFWPGEDTKLCLDLIKTGKKILYDPSVLVFHHRRAVFLPHLKQVSRYGMHRGQFARIFPETSLKLAYFVPSLFVLGLSLGPFSFLVSKFFILPYFFCVYLYILLLLSEAFKTYKRTGVLKMIPYFIVGTFLTHLVYGVCILYGLFVKPKLNLRDIDGKTKKYLGG
ncbi:MAG: glycosyltransferase [Patescibacteria group bacterium]